MPATTNGAELLRLLKESGTPDGKLAGARRLLTDRYRAHREIATAAEVVVALEAEFGPDHMTVEKAKQLATTGQFVPPATTATTSTPIEELLLRGGAVSLPEPAAPVLPIDPSTAPAVTAADLRTVLDRLGGLEKLVGDRTAENLALRTAADEANARAAAAEAALAEAKAAAEAAATSAPAGDADKPAGEPTTTSPPPPAAHAGGNRPHGRK